MTLSVAENAAAEGATVGLRVDVDTFRGTRFGVPNLVEQLARHDVRASFFMSVGPDNMGRHLWRLLRPTFLWKMLRSNAASLYGWDILLCGTFGPGPMIGDRLRAEVRLPDENGHEVGLHAWDHYTWQTGIDRLTAAALKQQMQLGFDKLADILGHAPRCSAAAGWRCNEAALVGKESFNFAYNSDCRGTSIFCPVVAGAALTPQVPVTLPTYDEVIGQNGVNDANYNDYLLDQVKPGQLNVYTIHAEVEGIVRRELFEQLLCKARARGIRFKPLGELLPPPPLPRGALVAERLAGREGWLATQGAERR